MKKSHFAELFAEFFFKMIIDAGGTMGRTWARRFGGTDERTEIDTRRAAGSMD